MLSFSSLIRCSTSVDTFKLVVMIASILLIGFLRLSSAVEFPCEYITSSEGYSCTIPYGSKVIVDQQDEFFTITGKHLSQLRNEDVTSLYINQPNVLKFFPTNLFKVFNNLHKILLYDVKLTTWITDAITDCVSLETINIQTNNFRKLARGFAESCSNVKVLILTDNGIDTIGEHDFEGLTNLEELYLDMNSITSLDASMFTYTPKLKIFEVGRNNISSLDKNTFSSLSRLESIDLSLNRIQFLPDLVFGNEQVYNGINLVYNKIEAIDPSFFNQPLAETYPLSISLVGNDCVNMNFNRYPNPPTEDKLQNCYANWNGTPTIKTTTTRRLLTDSHRDCRYFIDQNNMYSCVLENVNINLTSIGGEHQIIQGFFFTDANVKAVHIRGSIINNIPRSILEKFPNIETFSVTLSKFMIDDNDDA